MIEEKNQNIGIRAQNFRSLIEQVIIGYDSEPAKGLVHGFQKDVIQNGWGHRISKNGENWKMIIKYLENDKGKFLVVEDCGSTGLIGHNYSIEELNIMMENNQSLPPEEKLARFSSLYNSGGNTDSPGLYGRGKLMYQAVSNVYKCYFDSLTINGNYVANYIDLRQQMLDKANEGNKARDYIKYNTGLTEKTTTGTRIIICDPKSEIVEAILNGKILDYINETWWRIFEKYNADVEVYYNDTLIGYGSVPSIYEKYYHDNNFSYVTGPISFKPGYRVKKIGFFYTEENDELDSDLGNISFYRKDMKIGNIFSLNELSVDEKYKQRISGFVEFDKDWEIELETNETLEHYGVRNRRENSFQYIKKIVGIYLDEFAIMKGLKAREKRNDPDAKLKDLARDLTDFLKDCNINLDWNSVKSKKNINPIQLSLIKNYPNSGLRTLEYDQEMKFQYKVKRMNIPDTNFKIYISIFSSKNEKRDLLVDDICVNSNQYISNQITIPFNEFYINDRNLVRVEIRSLDEKIHDVSTFPVFVNIDEEIEEDDIVFKLQSINFPDENSRTVRNQQRIENISLIIKNNTNKNIVLSISGFTQDVNDRNNTIEKIYSNNNISVQAGGNSLIHADDILFGEKYINRKGPIKIRYKLSHISGFDELEKGKVLSEIGVTILYEVDQIDETINLFDISTFDGNNKYIKSELAESNNGMGYALKFNSNYILYSLITSDENEMSYKLYYIEEMLKAIISIKMRQNDYTILESPYNDIDECTPNELDLLIKKCTDKYIAQYFEKRY